jgi:hypothetical protein
MFGIIWERFQKTDPYDRYNYLKTAKVNIQYDCISFTTCHLRILAVAIGAEAFKNICTFSKTLINRTSDSFVRVCRIQAFGRTKKAKFSL